MALLDHLPGGGLQREEQALGIDLEQPVPALPADLEQRSHVEHAGVVDQDVEPARPLGHGLHQPVDVRLPGDVEAAGECPAARSFDLGRGPLRPSSLTSAITTSAPSAP